MNYTQYISIDSNNRFGKPCIIGIIDISVLNGSPTENNLAKVGKYFDNTIAEIIMSNQMIIKEFLANAEVAYLELA